MDLEKKILALKEASYANFINKTSPSSIPFIGIRTKYIDKFVKTLNVEDVKSLDLNKGEEFIFIYLDVHLKSLNSLDEQFDFIVRNKDYLTCWAIVDNFMKYLKYDDFESAFRLYLRYRNDENEYLARCAYIVLFKYHYDILKIERLLDSLITDNRHFVIYAQAWLLSKLYNSFKTEIESFLMKNKEINLPLVRLTISKIRDSYLVSAEDKNRLITWRNSLKK